MTTKIKNLISQMTLEEKACLCSGDNAWETKAIERLGIKAMFLTDGPHGLRRSDLTAAVKIKTTCFPTACASACSFDPDLLYKMGEAIAKECQQEKVSIILGPGINLKRSPLCGRNFEYFSEDPLLAGKMAAAWVKGVQDGGVGTSLKHFACNNQEYRRLISDSRLDERALRELYLYAFEIVVKAAQPTTIMCAYNRINGEFASENSYILTDILRKEWGFEGFVVSDWGAVNDRVKGLKAGLELQMPAERYDDKKIVEAVKNGTLDEKILDEALFRILKITLTLFKQRKENSTYNQKAHHKIAQSIAEQSIVLLKNEEQILPLSPSSSIAVIGEFAQKPRYQGNGSSLIDPTQLDSTSEYFKEHGLEFSYARGYDANKDELDELLLQEAVELAKTKDYVVVFAGLISAYESEGFDRKHMNIPKNHNILIEELCKVNKNVVVVLCIGAPIVMPWLSQVKAVLNTYLGGQAVISATWRVLFGEVNPSGKLAESFPLKLEDNPSFNYFPGGTEAVEYRESIFVGYRYYDSANKEVLFPFGYGLSYTQFHLSNLTTQKSFNADTAKKLELSFDIANTGKYDGAEVVQVYISAPKGKILRASKELKAFKKVFLKQGEKRTLNITLDTRSFAYYDVKSQSYQVENGEYEILLGNSSKNISLSSKISVSSSHQVQDIKNELSAYFNFSPNASLHIEDAQFEKLLGRKLQSINRVVSKPYHMNNNLEDTLDTKAGRAIFERLNKKIDSMYDDGTTDTILMFKALVREMPLRSLPALAVVTKEEVNDILKELNESQ